MSYSSELKSSLRELPFKRKCCKNSFYYGYQLFTPPNKRGDNVGFTHFGHAEGQEPDSINTGYFCCPSCRSAFVRGAFIACGTISDPQKSYHLEFNIHSPSLTDELGGLLSKNGVEMKRVKRRDRESLYLKNGEDIQDLMHYMGAQKEAFGFANEKIRKELLNNANRARNCDSVNIKKAVSAAQNSIEIIKKLKKSGKFGELPEALAVTAQLRLDNPEATLGELVALHKEVITKSGVNHRLKKIIDMSLNN